jgi:hypothetical protein
VRRKVRGGERGTVQNAFLLYFSLFLNYEQQCELHTGLVVISLRMTAPKAFLVTRSTVTIRLSVALSVALSVSRVGVRVGIGGRVGGGGRSGGAIENAWV